MAAEAATKSKKYFSPVVIVSVLAAAAIIFGLFYAWSMFKGPKGLTQAQYDALTAENKAKYKFDSASGLYIAA